MSKEEEKIINTQLYDFKLPVIKTYFFRSTIPEKLDKEVKDMRDDFSQATKDLLANRVGWKCSNPQCRRPTRAAGSKEETVINIGVAAHITAAAKGGPRYDKNMSVAQRKSAENGIWLCQTCSKMIDSDVSKYTIEMLKEWKQISERMAVQDLESLHDTELNGKMSDNIDEFSKRICGDDEIEKTLLQALDIAKSSDNLHEALEIAENALKRAEENPESSNMQYSISNAQTIIAKILLVMHKDLNRAFDLVNQAIKNRYFNCKSNKLCGALIVKSGIALALSKIADAWGSILAAEKMSDVESTENQIRYFKALIMVERGEAFEAKELFQKCLDYYSAQIFTCTNEEETMFLKVEYADVLNSMGNLLKQVGDYFDAIEFYQSAGTGLQNTCYLSSIILYDLNYAECLLELREENYVVQCLDFLISIEDDVKKLSQNILKKRYFELRSKVYYYFENIIEFENDIKLVIEYSEDLKEKIYFYQILANNIVYDCNCNKIFEYLDEAEKLANKLGDKSLIYSIHEQRDKIGKYVNYKYMDDETLLTKIPSEEEFKDIINIVEIEKLSTEEEKDAAWKQSLKDFIENIQVNHVKSDKRISQGLLNELIKRAEKEGNPLEKAGIYNEIGHKYCLNGELVKAKYWQNMAYNKAKNTHNIKLKAFILMALADIALLTHNQSDEEKAKNYIEEVDTLISGKPYWQIYARCELFKAEFEGRASNYEKAQEHIKESQRIIKEYKLKMDDDFNYTLNKCISYIENRLLKVICHQKDMINLNQERIWLEEWYPKYKRKLRRYWWYYRGNDIIIHLRFLKKAIGIIALENIYAIQLFGEALSTLFSISAYAIKEDLSSIENVSLYTLPVPENTPFPFSISFVTEEDTEKYGYVENIDGTNKHYPYTMIASEEHFDQELNPKPITLAYTGIDIPDAVYKIPIVTQWKEKSGLWWISSNFGNDDDFVVNVLNCAKDLKAIPVFDYKNVDLCNKVKIISIKKILVPFYDPLLNKCDFLKIESLRSIIQELSILTSVSEIQSCIDELSEELECLSITLNRGTYVDIAVLSFPQKVWIDNFTKTTYYPALLLSESVIINKETYDVVTTKISTIAEVYGEW